MDDAINNNYEFKYILDNKKDYIEKNIDIDINYDNKNDFLLFDNYLEYSVLMKMKRKLDGLGSDISPLDLENRIYFSHGKILTERAKILYEVKRILKHLKEMDKDDLDKSRMEIYDIFSKLIKHLSTFDNDNDLLELKKIIVKIQISLNIKSGFYTVVSEMLQENPIYKGDKSK